MKLSIVIPCYNEAKNIPLIFNKINKLKIDSKEIEFVIVENGSSDGSLKILNELNSKSKYTKIVTLASNRGYGHGIISGLRECSGEFLGWTHADLQTDLSDILIAFKILEQHNFKKKLFIKGTRHGRPFFDQLFTSCMSLFESILMSSILSDINGQPNILHRSEFEHWKNAPHDFSLDLYALYTAKKQNNIVIRFPVLFSKRIHGYSNWNTSFANKLKFIKRTIDFSFQLKKRMK